MCSPNDNPKRLLDYQPPIIEPPVDGRRIVSRSLLFFGLLLLIAALFFPSRIELWAMALACGAGSVWILYAS